MKKTIPLLLLFSIIFSACEKEIEVDMPPAKPMMVLNSFYYNDSILQVQISKSVGALENKEMELVNDAQVSVYDNGSLLAVLTPKGKGMYESTKMATTGATYKITAQHGSLTEVSASFTMPAVAKLNSITASDSGYTRFDKTVFAKIQVSIQDLVNEKNYYSLEVYREDLYLAEDSTLKKGFSRVEVDTEDPNLVKYEEEWLTDDAYFDGKEYNFVLYIPSAVFQSVKAAAGDSRLFAKLNAVSYEYFMYKSTLRKYRQSAGNPFSEPVRVYSNIDGGLGIWAGCSSDMKEIK